MPLAIVHFFLGAFSAMQPLSRLPLIAPMILIIIHHLNRSLFHLCLSIGLLSMGYLYHSHCIALFESDVKDFTRFLHQGSPCLMQVVSFPVSRNHKLTFKAKLISCSHWTPQSTLFLQLSGRITPPEFGDIIYASLSDTRFIDPDFLYACQPRRQRASRLTSFFYVSRPHTLLPVTGSLYSSDLFVHMRKQVVATFLLHHESIVPRSVIAYFMAILFGEQAYLSPEQWNGLKATSTAHLVAISGLHITLMGRLITPLFIPLAAFFNRSNPFLLSEILSCCCLLLYAVVSGFSASCQRATLMFFISTLFRLCHAKPQSLHILLFSAQLQYLADPGQFEQIGCQLSYGIVLSLLLAQRYSHWLATSQRWIITPLITTLWSFTYWGQISLISPLCNWIAVPWISRVLLPLSIFYLICYYCLGQPVLLLLRIIHLQWICFDALLTLLSKIFPLIDLSFLFI